VKQGWPRLIPEVYRQALDETKLKARRGPDLQRSASKDAPLSFSAWWRSSRHHAGEYAGSR